MIKFRLEHYEQWKSLPFCTELTYLGVTSDRSLTFHRYLSSLRKKLTFRFALLRRLAESGWGAALTFVMKVAASWHFRLETEWWI